MGGASKVGVSWDSVTRRALFCSVGGHSEQKASQPPRPLSACVLSVTRWPKQFFVFFFYTMLGADPGPGACQTSRLLLSHILTQALTSSEGN